MREVERSPLPVSLGGLLRGRDLAGNATLFVRGDALEIARGERALALPLASLEGVRMRGDLLEVFLDTGDVVEARGSEELLPHLARHIEKRACIVPELTLSLRSFGSRRAFPGPEHDRFFGPLLEARRRAERALGPAGVRSAFDAPSLRREIDGVLRSLAAARHPSRAPEQRALVAELLEAAAALFAVIDAMGVAQRSVEDSDGADRIARWREWSVMVNDLFVRADATWLSVHALLDSSTPTRRGWRRFLR